MCLHDRPAKHKTPAALWLRTWPLQPVGSNIHRTIVPRGPEPRARAAAVRLAGVGMHTEGGSDPTASLLQLGGDRTARGARVLFTYSVASSYLLVTKESLVTNTCHPEIWITILPCTRDSQFSKIEHYQCIQHKLVKNTATIRTFTCQVQQSPLQRLLLNPH